MNNEKLTVEQDAYVVKEEIPEMGTTIVMIEHEKN